MTRSATAGYERDLARPAKSWNGVAILARGTEPLETRLRPAGRSDDDQSRYLEAAVRGVLIGCLYLPNGNPAPGPKFDYKLRWLERLQAMPPSFMATGAPGGAGRRLQRHSERDRRLQAGALDGRRPVPA